MAKFSNNNNNKTKQNKDRTKTKQDKTKQDRENASTYFVKSRKYVICPSDTRGSREAVHELQLYTLRIGRKEKMDIRCPGHS